jgi:cytochrome c-type biogenesis protein CcmH
MSRARALAVAAAAMVCMAASADPSERLKDPSQEARARHLFQQLRCVVCQNESIDDSDADLAKDLRMIVRQQVAAGRSDDQIRAFLVDRYGEFILLKPQLSVGNAVLWLTPVLILLAGGALFVSQARKPVRLEAALTPDEEKRLRALAGQDEPDTLHSKVAVSPKPGMTET